MRIAHIITRRELRGAEVVATDFCHRLASRGHETVLVGLYQPASVSDASVLAARHGRVIDLGGKRKGGLEPGLLWNLGKFLRGFQPDVVQAHAFHALKYSVLTRRVVGWRRWPIVYRNIGIASNWVQRPAQRSWGSWLLRQANHVISVSEASKADLIATYRIPASRVSVFRQGVDLPETIDRIASRQRLAALVQGDVGSEYLVHIGNFSPEKNHFGLLDAFRRIRESRPQVRLLLFGDGPLREEIAERVAMLGLTDQVDLLGARADVAELIAGADLLLLPSQIEGIPGVMLEACAQSVPVVATDVGGLREVLSDGTTGRLVAKGDMTAFANAVCELLESPQLRQRMGTQARAFVAARHNIDTVTAEFEELYRRLIGRRRPISKAGSHD